MLSGTVTNRYTQGLFAVAAAAGSVERVASGLDTVASTLHAHPELRALIEHPLIAGGAKIEVLERIFGQTVDETVYQFIRVLFARDRSAYVQTVATKFHELAEAAEGRVSVRIETAQPITDVERIRLEQSLATATGKQVTSELQVNSELLAGYRLRIGNRVLDATLRGAIDQFSERLLAAGASEEGTR